jgi:hypothetical protein
MAVEDTVPSGLLQRGLNESGQARAGVDSPVLVLGFGETAFADHVGESAAHGHQLGETAPLDDASVLEHQDLVGIGYRRQPMGDDEGRAATQQGIQGPLDLGFRFGV